MSDTPVNAPANSYPTWLYAPAYFWRMTDEEIAGYVNGCGSKCTKWFIPDYIWGLYVGHACAIHDIMYVFLSGDEKLSVERSAEDKASIDRVFRNNLLRIVERKGGWGPLVKLRRASAIGYYEAVEHLGAISYWDTAAVEAGQPTSPEAQLVKAGISVATPAAVLAEASRG